MITEDTPLVGKRDKSTLYVSFKLLLACPPDIWLLYIVKTTSFSGFSILFISGNLYLTEILNYSEKTTGAIFSVFGVVLGLYFILFSAVLSPFKPAKTLVFSNILGAIGYLLIIVTENEYIQMGSMLTFIMIAVSINIPTTKLLVMKYTVPQCRSLAYSLFYMALTLSGGVSAMLIDILLSSFNRSPTGFKGCFILGAGMVGLTAILACFLRDIDLAPSPQPPLCGQLTNLLKLRVFWKFSGLTIFIVVIKSLLFHLGATLPIYMSKTLGPGSHFGYIIGLHESVLLLSTPFLTVLAEYISNYSLIVIGGLVLSASPLFLLSGTGYPSLCLFVCVLALGDAIFAPRWLNYTIEVSPRGSERFFLAFASLPNSLSMMLAGQMSGLLLSAFCHEENPQCVLVWVCIAASSLVASFCIFALKPVLHS